MTSNAGRQTVFISCLVFILYLLLLPTNPLSMFNDADTLWHLATGDLIRNSGHLPDHDTWSFTAGDKRWQNISWGWDVMLSYIYQHFGWHGLIAMNSLTIAATLALVFAACFIHSQDGLAAFLISFLVIACMLPTSIRPYQVTHLFTALMVLLLSQIARNQCAKPWLCLIPIIMVAWVNMHGGFLIAFFLLGMYGIEAILQKNWRMTAWLVGIGVASLIACLINPYGIGIGAATLQYLMTADVSALVNEYNPLSFSLGSFFPNFYIALFIILVILRPTPALKSEQWIAYSWLILAITTVRHLSIFAIVSAPLLAVGLHDLIIPKVKKPHTVTPFLRNMSVLSLRISQSASGMIMMLAISALSTAWLFTASARGLYETDSFQYPIDPEEEITFLETHYPHARILNHYNLGPPLIFFAQGKIPVFMDGRGPTAYPDQVFKDYACFQKGCDGWESILDRYKIDGILLFNEGAAQLYDRFNHRKGWKTVFKGPIATIFMREPK